MKVEIKVEIYSIKFGYLMSGLPLNSPSLEKRLEKNDVQVFWHLGLERTGTTFLQKEVFPKLEGLKYVPKADFYRFSQLLEESRDRKFLLSFELGRQFDIQVEAFAKKYPNTVPIIVLRKHSDWILSQYKRAVKNGYPKPFHEFFNLKSGSSEYDPGSLNYTEKLKKLSNSFTHPPVVLFYEDLRDRRQFLERLVKELDVSLPEINFRKRHASYSDSQLSFLLKFNRLINLRSSYQGPKLWKRPRSILLKIVRYGLLSIGQFHSENSLVSNNNIRDVDTVFQSDWEDCLSRFK